MGVTMRVLFATALVFVATPALAAPAPIEMVMACQQSLSDGRILVSNGNLLPPNARYVIKRYTPKGQDNGWSHGECVLSVTKGVSG